MKERAAAALPLVLLIALAAVSLWLSRLVQSESPRGPQRHAADFFVENFKMRRFDSDGQLLQTIAGEKLLHFPDDDTTIVSSPHMTYHRLPPTEVFARTALISTDGKEIDLVEDVQIVRHGVAGTPSTVMRTSTLKIFPETEKGHTDTPVVVTRDKSIVTGSGLTFDGKSHVSVLRGRVTGTFHRNQKRSP